MLSLIEYKKNMSMLEMNLYWNNSIHLKINAYDENDKIEKTNRLFIFLHR